MLKELNMLQPFEVKRDCAECGETKPLSEMSMYYPEVCQRCVNQAIFTRHLTTLLEPKPQPYKIRLSFNTKVLIVTLLMTLMITILVFVFGW